MIKRVIMLFAITLAAGAAVWAQTVPDSSEMPAISKPTVPDAPEAGDGRSGIVYLDVVPNLSTEARFSAGIFGSLGDDFIDPRFYDSTIGTFFFLGGQFSTERSTSGDNNVNFGFARNFGIFYLGAYYGGTLGRGSGAFSDRYLPGNVPAERWSEETWNSSLAVLFGIAGMGVRLDANAQTKTERAKFDGASVDGYFGETLKENRLEGGPSLALTWGAAPGFLSPLLGDAFGALSPWLRAGYKFADSYVLQREADDYKYEEKFSGNAVLETSLGADFSLGETSSLGGALTFVKTFPDREIYTGVTELGDDRDPEYPFSNRRFGMLAFAADVYYKQTFEIEHVSFGFQPRVNAALTRKSNDWVGGSFSWTEPGDQWLSIEGSIDLGARIWRNERLAFFTGLELRLFDWTRWSQTGGDEMNPARESSYAFSGIIVNDLTIGLTFALLDNVDLGLGLSQILNSGLFIRDVPTIDLTISTKLGR